MLPPRRRRPKVTRSLARLGIGVTLNLGAAFVTLLLVRSLIEVSGVPKTLRVSRLVRQVSEPFVWPLLRLPGIGGQPALADLLAIVVTAVMAAMIVGVIAGWEAEGQR